ncbi:hypothetical protein FKM82_022192 [Ascaphus truei]
MTSFILLITVVLEGALTCFQAAAIEHLAAVKMAMISLDIGGGRSSVGLFSTRVNGSRGRESPVTPKISICTSESPDMTTKCGSCPPFDHIPASIGPMCRGRFGSA